MLKHGSFLLSGSGAETSGVDLGRQGGVLDGVVGVPAARSAAACPGLSNGHIPPSLFGGSEFRMGTELKGWFGRLEVWPGGTLVKASYSSGRGVGREERPVVKDVKTTDDGYQVHLSDGVVINRMNGEISVCPGEYVRVVSGDFTEVFFYKGRQRGKRGRITTFSRKSRQRMKCFLAKVDFSKGLPCFGTSTFPDDVEIGDMETVKRSLDVMVKRFRRAFPSCGMVWRMEFESRKTGVHVGQYQAHFHWLIWALPRKFPFRRESGRWVTMDQDPISREWVQRVHYDKRSGKVKDSLTGVVHRGETETFEERVQEERCPAGSQDRFHEWFSRNWYDVVGTGNISHFKSGTSNEKMVSARQTTGYVSKYVSKDQEAGIPAVPGRFWGVCGGANIPMCERVVLDISPRVAIKIMRLQRRAMRYNAKGEKRRVRCCYHFKLKTLNSKGENFIERREHQSQTLFTRYDQGGIVGNSGVWLEWAKRLVELDAQHLNDEIGEYDRKYRSESEKHAKHAKTVFDRIARHAAELVPVWAEQKRLDRAVDLVSVIHESLEEQGYEI